MRRRRALRGLRYQDQRERRQAEREPDMMTGADIAGRREGRRLRGLEFHVRIDAAVAYYDASDIRRREVILDEGSRIVVLRQSDETIAAALRLAPERWGGEVTLMAARLLKSARRTSRRSSAFTC